MPATPRKTVASRKNTAVAIGQRPAHPGRTQPSKTLDVFPNPNPDRDYLIHMQVPEFTCLCPLTGQPDFATFTIDCIPDALCVELKSLKLYFWSYRDVGAFHEAVTNSIVDDIVAASRPRFVRIVARWNVRGGIATNVVAEYRKPGWTPPPPVVLPPDGGVGSRS
jgi:7-cyano-7-deazaguanine reductase